MHILNIGSGVYSICLVYIHVDMDGEDREYSESTFFFWLVQLFYTLFLSHRILFHSLRLLAWDILQK